MKENFEPPAMTFLKKADNHLCACKAILKNCETKATDMVCFHAHQVIECCLKALLADNYEKFPTSGRDGHDLSVLLNSAKNFEPGIIAYEKQISEMTDYAVGLRYDSTYKPTLDEEKEILKDTIIEPDGTMLFSAPSLTKAKDSLKTAEDIFNLIKNRIGWIEI